MMLTISIFDLLKGDYVPGVSPSEAQRFLNGKTEERRQMVLYAQLEDMHRVTTKETDQHSNDKDCDLLVVSRAWMETSV